MYTNVRYLNDEKRIDDPTISRHTSTRIELETCVDDHAQDSREDLNYACNSKLKYLQSDLRYS